VNTCVLPASRRNARACKMRAPSRANAARYACSGSTCMRAVRGPVPGAATCAGSRRADLASLLIHVWLYRIALAADPHIQTRPRLSPI
jgi:hypothetical protein